MGCHASYRRFTRQLGCASRREHFQIGAVAQQLTKVALPNSLRLLCFAELGLDRYKVVVQAVIGEQRGEGVK